MSTIEVTIWEPVRTPVCLFTCSDEIRQKMVSKYLNNPDYNFEKVNRASQACGPMVKWAIAQVGQYCHGDSDIFKL